MEKRGLLILIVLILAVAGLFYFQVIQLSPYKMIRAPLNVTNSTNSSSSHQQITLEKSMSAVTKQELATFLNEGERIVAMIENDDEEFPITLIYETQEREFDSIAVTTAGCTYYPAPRPGTYPICQPDFTTCKYCVGISTPVGKCICKDILY